MSAPESQTVRDDDLQELLDGLYRDARGVPTAEDAAILDAAIRAADRAHLERHPTIDMLIDRIPVEVEAPVLEERLLAIAPAIAACGPIRRDQLIERISKTWNVKAPTLKALFKGSAPAVSDDGDGGDNRNTGDGAPEVDTRTIIQSVIETYKLIRDPSGVEYLCMGSEAVSVTTKAFGQRIAYLVRDAKSISVTSNQVSDAVHPLLGGELEVVEVPIRVAGDEQQIVLDIADGTGRVIVINASGARIETTSPCCFLRPPGIAPLPEPIFPTTEIEAQATLAEYWALSGIPSDDTGDAALLARAATHTWLMSAIRKSTNYVLAFLVGSRGTGKTWRARMLRDAIDPYALDVESLPSDLEQLGVCAANSHAQAFDNVSRISGEISDGLCSLATGGGRRARRLYTDGEAAIFKFARPVIITSIVEALSEPDLLDRAIIIRATKRPQRKSDEALKRAFEKLHPRLLGTLCYLASVAIRSLESTVVSDDIRMQSAARFGAASEEAAGLPKGTVEKVFASAREDALNITAEDVVAKEILSWVREPGFRLLFGEQWKGTATELHERLTDRVCGSDDKGRPLKRSGRRWPADGRGLSSALRRLSSSLLELGVEVIFESEGTGASKHRVVVVRRLGVEWDTNTPSLGLTWDADVDPTDPANIPENKPSQDCGTLGTLGTHECDTSASREPRDSEASTRRTVTEELLASFSEREGTSVPSVPSVPALQNKVVDAGRIEESMRPKRPTATASDGSSASQDPTQVWHRARALDHWFDQVEEGPLAGERRLTIEFELADGSAAHGYYVGASLIATATHCVKNATARVRVREQLYSDGNRGWRVLELRPVVEVAA